MTPEDILSKLHTKQVKAGHYNPDLPDQLIISFNDGTSLVINAHADLQNMTGFVSFDLEKASQVNGTPGTHSQGEITHV